MMNPRLRGTCVLTAGLGAVLFSPVPAMSGGTGVCCDPNGCFASGGCSTGTFIDNVDCSSNPCCGDGTCAADEDSCTCPDDCPDAPDSCSACECGGQDSAGNCWCDSACALIGDCCADVCDQCPCCGDGICDANEEYCTCPDDCPDPNPDLCDPCECGTASTNCFCDDICVVSGDCCSNACDDCGYCSVCADGTCSPDEDCFGCPADCLSCGDGSCDFLCEDNCSCPEDCSACGDGFCDTLCEDCVNCPGDCVCGACCTGPDLCQVTLETDCAGEYQGDGTFCDVGTCEPPTGACCIDNQPCDVVGANQCNAGVYQGDGTTCSPDPCDRQCCFSDGGCQNLPGADCNSQGGTPGDPGSDCSSNSCPQPTGACVSAGGTCTETTQTDCFNSGGTFLGAGTSCGACCLSDGSCMETTEADCTGSFQGAYQGDDTLCADVMCAQPPTGACCDTDGSCSETTQIDCGGSYQGGGSSCDTTVCGACCLERAPTIAGIGAGGVCAGLAETECFNYGGVFQGAGTGCEPNPCPQPGACCVAPSSAIAAPVFEDQCITVLESQCPGTFHGEGVSCDTNPCPHGCCFANGSCQELSDADCIAQGGSAQGSLAHCDLEPILCPDPLGACCGSPGRDCFTAPAIVCIGFGGTYQGDGTTCEAPGPCVRGCCFPDGSCQELSGPDCVAQGGSPQGDQAHCDLEPSLCPDPFGACCGVGSCFTAPRLACMGLGGSYQGDNTTCDPDPCLHACCFPDGSCQVLVPAECTAAGGSPQGVLNCDNEPILCPDPLGACCGAGDCFTAPEGACTGLGGTWQGANTTCDPDPCPAPTFACCTFAGCTDNVDPTACQGTVVVGTCADSDCVPFSCCTFAGCEDAVDPKLCEGVVGVGTCAELAEFCTPFSCCTFAGCIDAVDPKLCEGTVGVGTCEELAEFCIPFSCCTLAGCVDGVDPNLCEGIVGVGTCAEIGSFCYGCCTSAGCTDSVDPGLCQGTVILGSCANSNCVPTGACCYELAIPGVPPPPFQVFCQDDTTLSDCRELGSSVGEYQGDGTTCAKVGCATPIGACCVGPSDAGTVAGDFVLGCLEVSEVQCQMAFGGEYLGDGTSCETSTCNPERADISTKGSLLIFSDVELGWSVGPAAGVVSTLTTDTVISLTNDYPGEVYVQMYFINGDPELDPLFVGTPPTLVREGEPGCNWVDCQLLLTPDQPIYWSAATGSPAGCQPFDILDPDLGSGPGRPNPDAADGTRVLRGYIVAWAVDASGREINWNHLSGKATIVDYAAQTAWEYEPWAFQAQENLHGEVMPQPGVLELNGIEYDQAFDMLLYDFFAAGSQAFSSDGSTVTLDGELILHPVTHDLRQEHDEPVTTKAHFDIWNLNERKLSNTRRCLTCWDQALLSTFNAPNSFRLENLQSDKGKARIDGKQANECEENCFRDPLGNPLPVEDLLELLGDLFGDVEVVCSQDAALLGVATKILTFSGPAGQRAVAGSPLVGMGFEPAVIQYDIIDPPGTLREDAFQRIGRTPPREHDRLDTAATKQRN